MQPARVPDLMTQGAMSRRRVGILGGMGPEATVLLMSRIVALTPAQDDADHIPLLVDMNPQVPSRIKALIEKTGEDPAPTLVAMARRLEAAGVAALAMACNTAHAYADAIASAVAIPFIDMVDATAVAAGRHLAEGGTVGVLASPAVRTLGLYDRALSARGLRALHPGEGANLLEAIRRLKRGGADSVAKAILRDAGAGLRDAGAGVLITACTEFSLALDALADFGPAVDSTEALAEAVVAYALA